MLSPAMDVVSSCPLRIAARPWQPRPGSHALVVVCKATFSLQPDESPLADEQQEPLEADAWWNDDPWRSLRAAGDIVPFKRHADVLVLGHAYAPGATPATSLVARITVGVFDKGIEVHADRGWTGDGRIVVEEPFLRAPLTWECAARGMSNPVGIATNAPADAHGLRRIPNLVPQGFELKSPTDVIPPVGFGPISPTWTSRTTLLGRHATSWDHRAWRLWPLPQDVDGAFFNAAPLDQQLVELHGDETIVLENLHPSHAFLATKLAPVHPVVTVRRQTGEAQQMHLRIDTLCIDTDRAIAMLVWRGIVVLAHAGEPGRIALAMETTRPTRKRGPTVPIDVWTPGTPPPRATPFEQAAPGAPSPAVGPSPEIPAAAVRAVVPNPTIHEMEPQPETSPQTQDPQRHAFVPWLPNPSAGLPFQSTNAPVAPAPEPNDVVASFDEAPDTWNSPKDRYVDREPSEQVSLPVDVAEPAMVGPIPVQKTWVPSGEVPEEQKEERSEARTETLAPQIAPESEPIELSLEQTAAIAAELGERKTDRQSVLDAHGLREKYWRKNEARWNTAIEEEARRGAHSLQNTYDTSYVERVEQFRGPIDIDTYARIAVGLERGQAHAVLDSLAIQRAALMPIVRLWTKKVAKDMTLGAKAKQAFSTARRA